MYHSEIVYESGNEINRIDTKYAFLSLSKTYIDDMKKIREFFKYKKYGILIIE